MGLAWQIQHRWPEEDLISYLDVSPNELLLLRFEDRLDIVCFNCWTDTPLRWRGLPQPVGPASSYEPERSQPLVADALAARRMENNLWAIGAVAHRPRWVLPWNTPRRLYRRWTRCRRRSERPPRWMTTAGQSAQSSSIGSHRTSSGWFHTSDRLLGGFLTAVQGQSESRSCYSLFYLLFQVEIMYNL